MKSVNLLFLLTEAAVRRKNKLKISVLKHFAIFPRKHLYWSLFLIKKYNFIKKILQHRLFPLNIAKLLRARILKNICEQLLCIFYMLTVTLSYFLFFCWRFLPRTGGTFLHGVDSLKKQTVDKLLLTFLRIFTYLFQWP